MKLGDSMKKFKQSIKDNIVYTLVVVITLFVSLYELPYYIESPGSLVDTNDRITIENQYESKGSFNMTYVSQMKATPLFYLYAGDAKKLCTVLMFLILMIFL